MCGIFVVFSKKKNSININLAKKSLNLLKNRGPDSSGVFIDDNIFLGSRRLRITDNNPNSDQPFFSDCNNYVITFNGMIYNFADIKKKLITKGIKFNTKSDTEVLLKNFIHNKNNFLNSFSGMWAGAIWNKRNNELVVFRDRLGIKPLYFYSDRNEYIFSSEIKSILNYKKQKIKISKSRVLRYFSRGWADDLDKTFFTNISHVQPGSIIHLNSKNIAKKIYWNLKPKMHNQFSINKLKKLIINKTKQYSKTEKFIQPGITLSSGIDSAGITAIIAKYINSKLNSYTIVPPNCVDETPHSLIRNTKINHKTISLSSIKLDKLIDKILQVNDEPVNGINIVYQFYLREIIKKDGIKVLLTGEGADEVFSGYERMYYYYLISIKNDKKYFNNQLEYGQRFLKLKKEDILLQLKNYETQYNTKIFYQENEFMENLISSSFKKNFREIKNEKIYNKFSQIKRNALFNYLNFHLFNRYIPFILRMHDRISGAYGIEERVPFLDHEIIEMAWSANHKEFMKNGNNKKILRNVFKDILPKKILNNKIKSRKPGSNSHSVYKVLKNKILYNLNNKKNRANIFLDDLAINQFKKDVNNNNVNSSIFWIRYYFICRWLKVLNKYEIIL